MDRARPIDRHQWLNPTEDATMFTRRLHSIAALVAATGLLSGCLSSDNSLTAGSTAAGSEDGAIQSIIFEEMSEYTDLDVRHVDDGSGPSLVAIETLRWWREVQNVARTVEISIDVPSDAVATADVTITGEVTGLLHLLSVKENELFAFAKDFDDTGVRHLYFEKVRRPSPRHRGWKLQAMSGVEIASAGTTRQINWINIQAGDVDATITSVSELIAMEDLLRLPAGTEVIVTVDTGDETDAVFMHLRRRWRRELTSNNNGTFTGSFTTNAERRGPRHLAIDVLSHGTLYDDEVAYDNVAWAYPFLIRDQDELTDDAS
jgi:hypothetical protein